MKYAFIFKTFQTVSFISWESKQDESLYYHGTELNENNKIILKIETVTLIDYFPFFKHMQKYTDYFI